AFVVNMIVAAKDLGMLREVIHTIMRESKDLDDRVAFVVGVNVKSSDTAHQELKEQLDKADLGGIDYPVALTGFTWEPIKEEPGKKEQLPYGTMRNTTLQSAVNKFAIAAMRSKGNHPYIAVQDFDEGSRTLRSGEHIFTHVIDSTRVGEGLPPSRPLMFSGGYRPRPKVVEEAKAEADSELAKLEPDSKAANRLKKAKERLEKATFHEEFV